MTAPKFPPRVYASYDDGDSYFTWDDEKDNGSDTVPIGSYISEAESLHREKLAALKAKEHAYSHSLEIVTHTELSLRSMASQITRERDAIRAQIEEMEK